MLHTAGLTLDEDIRRYIRRERDIMVGRLSAEQMKLQMGYAGLRDAELAMAVKGKSYLTGMPVVFELTSTEVFLAMREHLEQIASTIRAVLSQTTPDLLADIAESGIILTCGSAQMPGIAQYMERKTGVPMRVADDPANCVVCGIGTVLNHMDILEAGGYLFQATPSPQRIQT